MTSKHKNAFATAILNWHLTIDRNLPWKTSNDPYKIWLSEIIMQQTRVAQGTPYYLKFVAAFPTITDLANAEESQVMKLWQGLGYYSRARNLHFTAQVVRDKYNGSFPTEYKDILGLKGIGQYTAAAISSFAFGKEYPVIDGNVIRLISRYFGITTAVDTSQTLKEINNFATKLIKGSDPGDYNQAIMDFGALMCTPKSPNCTTCTLNPTCLAFGTNQVDSIPYKSKKIIKKTRFLHYFYIVDSSENIILRHRTENDIWKALFDFPCVENDNRDILTNTEIQNFVLKATDTKAVEIKLPTKVYKHILTHQTIFGQFYKIVIGEFPEKIMKFTLVKEQEINSFALPVLISNYLSDTEELTLF